VAHDAAGAVKSALPNAVEMPVKMAGLEIIEAIARFGGEQTIARVTLQGMAPVG
jgi:hypothetical protein